MKVYVKKDKALKLLGEGKIYSKKDLVLKEQNGTVNPNIVNIQAAHNVQDAAMQFNQAKAKNPTIMQGAGSGDDMQVQTNGTTDNILMVNSKSPESQMMAQDTLNKMSTDQKQDTDVTFFDGNETPNPLENSSVTPRKVMDEMRENSVPFTKAELTEFLKNL